MKHYSLSHESIHQGTLILVNPKYRYHEPHNTNLITVHNSAPTVQMEYCAVVHLQELMKHIFGWNKIVPVSGWRSLSEQQSIWEHTIDESGLEFTRRFVAVPGHSEHQTGLAIDLGLKQEHVDFICPNFPYDGICQVFRNHAADYGFIERYPAGKETITGIGHEPWHFRYVGIPHALIMEKYHLTLEEYMDFIRDYPFGRPFYFTGHGLDISVSYLISDTENDTEFEINDRIPHSISGNNIDGFILTEWRTTHDK